MGRIPGIAADLGINRYITPLVAAGCAAGYAAVAAATTVVPFALFAVAVSVAVVRTGRGRGRSLLPWVSG